MPTQPFSVEIVEQHFEDLSRRRYAEIARVLKPGGRVQIADICVELEVPESARKDIDLWTG